MCTHFSLLNLHNWGQANHKVAVAKWALCGNCVSDKVIGSGSKSVPPELRPFPCPAELGSIGSTWHLPPAEWQIEAVSGHFRGSHVVNNLVLWFFTWLKRRLKLNPIWLNHKNNNPRICDLGALYRLGFSCNINEKQCWALNTECLKLEKLPNLV